VDKARQKAFCAVSHQHLPLISFSVFCFAGFFSSGGGFLGFFYISTTLLDIAVDMYGEFVKSMQTFMYSFQFP